MKFAIRKVVSDNHNGRYVGVEKPAEFNSFSDEEYYKFYYECVANGHLRDDGFGSEAWQLINDDLTTSIIKFNTILFIKELKRYTIVMLRFSTNQPSTIAKELRMIIWGLKETNFLSEFGHEELIYKIEIYNTHEIRKIRCLDRFIKFIDAVKYFEYIEVLQGLNSNESARLIRTLPDYDSLLKFDYYINDFYKDGPQEQRKLYFPIIIWWKFSSIVPMRPLEVAELPKNCVYETNGDYYIKLIRFKETRSIIDDYRTNEDIREKDIDTRRRQVIKISKEMFDLFNEYIYTYKPSEDRTQFFELKFQQNNKRSALSDLLTEFNSEIIEKYYGLRTLSVHDHKKYTDEIKLPRLGVTRHLAFCSMMLQGFNPLTIMEIGGHENINSQLHYTRHMDIFAESSINQISRAMTELILSGDTSVKYAGIGRKNIAKLASLGDAFYDLPKVTGGRCTSKDVPNSCPPTECIYCEKHFVFDDSKAYLDKLQLEKERELKSKLEYIKHLYSEAVNNRNSNLERNEHLKTSANELQALARQKALLDTYQSI